MNAPLSRFFSEMESLLLGRTTADQAQAVLGPSPSGSQNFAFYRTLIDRNFHKTLRLLFPSVRVLAQRTREGLWSDWVRGFVAAHPPRGCRDPNRMGASFSEFLARECEADRALPGIVEELAEYHWIDYVAGTATDDEGDGFERRVFIREFTYPIPTFMRAVTDDATAEVPAPQPTLVVLYRSLVHGAVRILYPNAQALAVFAKRQGLDLPPALAEIDEEILRSVEDGLVEMGLLTPASPGTRE